MRGVRQHGVMSTDRSMRTDPARTLLVLRHAKSDWDVGVSDRERPLAARGRRQAPPMGRWLTREGLVPDHAIVSVAVRARQTWALVADDLPAPVTTEFSEAAYTFDGDDLLVLVREAARGVGVLALVGHNPAVEELVETLTGDWAQLETSSLAVVDLAGEQWGAGAGSLRWAGRPADASS